MAISRILSVQRTLEPAPDTAFVVEIFHSELALEIAFFVRDHDAILQAAIRGHRIDRDEI
jgi:hypothetical protein